MGISIEQAEKLLDDLATQEELLCKRADDASGYTRSGNESIRTSDAKTHEQHAKEYRQILRYLAEYRLMKAVYEARLKADMVAMLTDIQLEIEEKNFLESSCSFMDKTEEKNYAVYTDDISKVIQQKIDALKEQKDEKVIVSIPDNATNEEVLAVTLKAIFNEDANKLYDSKEYEEWLKSPYMKGNEDGKD